MDSIDKVVTLIDECRAMGLQVEPPRINHSDLRFTSQGSERIVYGLGAIKGVGEAAIGAMLAARAAAGPFSNLWDFCQRIDLQRANRRVLEALIRAGALDELGTNRATLMHQLPLALKLAEQHHAQQEAGQADLFGALDSAPAASGQPALAPDPQIAAECWPEWDDDERLQGEKETLGLYLTGHPINGFEAELSAMVPARIGPLLDGVRGLASPGVTPLRGNDRDTRTVVGLVLEVRINKTPRGRMAAVRLDDRTGRIEVTVFAELYERVRDLLIPDRILAVTGSLTFDQYRDGWSLRANEVKPLEAARAERADHLLLHLNLACAERYAGAQRQIAALHEALAPYRRPDQGLAVHLHYRQPRASGILRLGWRVDPADALLKRLRHVLGATAVEVIYLQGPRLRTAPPAAPPSLEPAPLPRLAAR